MKSNALTVFLSLLASTAVLRADLVLVQETAVGQVKSTSKMYISGDHIRSDNGDTSSVIMDASTGIMTTLVHEQKMAIEVNTAQLKAAAGAPLPAGAEQPVQKVTDTGRTEKVQGYDCKIYTVELGEAKSTMWIAKDYPGYDKLRKELAVMEKFSNGNAAQSPPELPGMAVKSEYEQQGLKFVTTVVSLTEEKVDPSLFKVPAGYKPPGQ